MAVTYLNKWEPVADDILSVLLANPQRWTEAVESTVTSEDMPPGAWRAVYMAVIEAAVAQGDQTTPLLDTTIATRAGADVSVEWVAERIAGYDEWRESRFAEQLEAAKRFGHGHRQLNAIRTATAKITNALNNGAETDEAVQVVVSDLQSEQMTRNDEPTTLSDLMVQNRALMDEPPQPKVTTGIPLLDEWVGGMGVNEFIAGVAPYKMRKTSVMANVVIHRLRNGDQVEVFSFDERRADFIYRLEAMLIAEHLWNNNQWGHSLNNVSPKMISMAGNKWRHWDTPLKVAFEYAYDTLAGWGKRCRVYDTRVCPATISSIAGLARMDAARYGQLGTIFVDHLQSLAGFRTIFDKAEEGAAALHLLRGELDCRLWLLAQQNEAAINGADEGGHSPNVKGGGGLASKADTVIVSKYMVGACTDPNYVRLEMRNARWEQSQLWGYSEIHPASGWITPRKVDSKNLNEALNAAIGAPQ